MSYNKQVWENKPSKNTPTSAERFNHMEDGIADAHAELDGRLAPGQLAVTYVTRGEQLVDAREWGTLQEGSVHAATNTAAIQDALSNSSVDVFIPAGAWHVIPGVITVPQGRVLRGVQAKNYSGAVAAVGTRLIAASTSGDGTGAVVKLEARSRVTDLAIIGSGASSALHHGIKLSNATTVERVTVTGCFNGINGSYSGMVLIRDVNVYGNGQHGLQDVVDSAVYGGYFNANRGSGISLGAGANDNLIMPTKVEWNDGHGVVLFSNVNNVVNSAIIDRQGKTGISAVSTKKTMLGPLLMRRNGRLAETTANDDAHLYLQENVDLTVVAPLSATGADDNGGGYVSPRYFSREADNVRLNIVGGDLGGSTLATKRSITSANVDSFEYGTSGNPYVDRRPLGRVAHWSNTVVAGGSGQMVIPLPPMGTFSPGDVTDIFVAVRNPSTGGRAAGRVPIFRSRESGGATVTVGPASNLVGNVVGSTVTITATVSADGSALTVTVSNGETSDRNISLTV